MKRWILSGFATLIFVSGCAPSADELRTRAISDFQLGRVDDAEQLLRRTMEIKPSDAETLFYMGRVKHVQGNLPQAMYYYQCAIDVDPSFDAARKWLARVEEEMGPTGKTLRFLP